MLYILKRIMEKEKKQISDTGKVFIVIGILAMMAASYWFGRIKGYNKGFDKGVGWQ